MPGICLRYVQRACVSLLLCLYLCVHEDEALFRYPDKRKELRHVVLVATPVGWRSVHRNLEYIIRKKEMDPKKHHYY